MVEIPLTRGKVAIVDDEFAHLSNWKWYAMRARNTFYAVRTFKSRGIRGTIFMHHAVIGRSLDKKLDTDHRNGNGLVNTLSNLRHITRRENSSNRRDRRDGKTSSNQAGVCWDNYFKKWVSRIQVNGRRKNLGHFTNENDAANAYKRAVNGIAA